jgi:hypothetical protein
MTAILSLLVVIFVSMLITRIATIALAATGLSRESARFQARSALTGSGFTTSESESVVRHPVRRRIVMMLMLVGSAGIAAVIGSIVLAFVQPDAAGDWWIRIAVLMAGIAGLWVFASSAWIDRRITRITMWALDRYTSIDVRDYASLLHIGGDYVITELTVPDGHWLADQSLAELDLRREGIMLLGVVRPDGEYLGVPRRDTVLHAGDTLVLYSRAGQLAELDARRRDEAGDESHRHAVEREADAREAHRG